MSSQYSSRNNNNYLSALQSSNSNHRPYPSSSREKLVSSHDKFIISQYYADPQSVSRLRLCLIHEVARATLIIQWLQRSRSLVLDYYFIIMSALGDQIIYTIMLPFLFWMVDPLFGRLFLLLLVTGTTIGNFIKMLIALPRPPSPPLWAYKRLEDFGMPSTHTLNAVSMSTFLTYWYWDAIPNIYLRILVVITICWYIVSMSLSRMYLSAHSHIDVLFGFILGFIFLIAWIYLAKPVDSFFTNHNYMYLVSGLAFILFLFFHPSTSRPSPTFKNTMALLGLGYGLSIGSNHAHHGRESWFAKLILPLCISSEYEAAKWASSNGQLISAKIVGVLIGMTLLYCTYTLFKLFWFHLFCQILQRPWGRKAVEWIKNMSRMYSIPHAIALDNIDYPQVIMDSLDGSPNIDAKIISNAMGTTMVGYLLSYLVPVALKCIGFLDPNIRVWALRETMTDPSLAWYRSIT